MTKPGAELFLPLACLASLACLAPPALCQTSRPAPQAKPAAFAKADAESQRLLRSWKRMEYHLGRAGVTRISYDVAAHCKLTAGTTPKTSTAKYRWVRRKDGSGRGELKWKDRAVGSLLGQLGWGADQLDQSQVPDVLERWLDGCELTAVDTPYGYKLIKVVGSPTGLRGLRFDKAGVLIGLEQGAALPRGGKVGMDFRLAYHKDGDKYHIEGWTHTVTMPNGEKYVTVAKISYKELSKYHVVDRVKETTKRNGTLVSSVELTFSNHRFNKQVVGKAGSREKGR